MGDTLLDHGGGLDDRRTSLGALAAFVGRDYFQFGLVEGQGVRVDGRLRDEAVGHGQAEDTGDEGGAAEEEEVPVEAAGLLERELAGLGC